MCTNTHIQELGTSTNKHELVHARVCASVSARAVFVACLNLYLCARYGFETWMRSVI